MSDIATSSKDITSVSFSISNPPEKSFFDQIQVQFYKLPDNTKLAYKLFKAKKNDENSTPIVLIQGWGGVKEDWGANWISILSESNDILIFDNRGIGQSDIPEGPYSMNLLAEDAANLILFVFGPNAKVHLAGISMGGMVAQVVYNNYPSIIQSLFLGCTYMGGPHTVLTNSGFFEARPSGPVAKEDVLNVTRKIQSFNFSPEFIKNNSNRFEQIVIEGMKYRRSNRGIMSQAGVFRKFYNSKLSDIHVPVFIAHGNNDQVIHVHNSRYMASRIKDCVYFELNGVGHSFWLMDNDRIALAYQLFIKKLEKSKHFDVSSKL